MDLTRQLSNLDSRVVDLLKSVLATDHPAVRTEAPVLVRHTILSETQVVELIQAYRAGDSIAVLRERFKIGKNSLYRHLKRAGVMPDRK